MTAINIIEFQTRISSAKQHLDNALSGARGETTTDHVFAGIFDGPLGFDPKSELQWARADIWVAEQILKHGDEATARAAETDAT